MAAAQCAHGHRESLARGVGLADGGLDQRDGLGLAGRADAAAPWRRRARRALPVASETASASAIRAAAAAEVAAPGGIMRRRRSGASGKLLERARVTGEPDLPGDDRAPAVVVPQNAWRRHRASQPHRSPSLDRSMSSPARRSAACRSAGAAAASPSVTSSARPSSSRSAGPRRSGDRGQRPGGTGDLRADRRRRPGRPANIAAARRPGRSRGPGPGRAARAAGPP